MKQLLFCSVEIKTNRIAKYSWHSWYYDQAKPKWELMRVQKGPETHMHFHRLSCALIDCERAQFLMTVDECFTRLAPVDETCSKTEDVRLDKLTCTCQRWTRPSPIFLADPLFRSTYWFVAMLTVKEALIAIWIWGTSTASRHYNVACWIQFVTFDNWKEIESSIFFFKILYPYAYLLTSKKIFSTSW